MNNMLCLNISVNLETRDVVELKVGITALEDVYLSKGFFRSVLQGGLSVTGPSVVDCKSLGSFGRTPAGQFMLKEQEYQEKSLYIGHLCDLERASSGEYKAKIDRTTAVCKEYGYYPPDHCHFEHLVAETVFTVDE